MKVNKVVSKMKKLRIATYQNRTFAQLTTLGCGGKIEWTIFPDTIKKLVRAVKYFCRNKIPFVTLGCGSNVLASDSDFRGVVICTKKLQKLKVKGNVLTVTCGVPAPHVAQICKQHGLTGGEFLACLPATVGGAVVCNAGCFGQNIQQIVQKVKVLRNGRITTLNNNQCKFCHRNSLFKNTNDVVLSVQLQFEQSTEQQVAHKIARFKQVKRATQPLSSRSAGCVLYHPLVAVSKLVDQAGLKGYTIGGAKVSKKHAGFVVNIDKATSKDIYLLIEYLRRTLLAKYNVHAQIELCLLNFCEDTNDILSNDQK